jgi:outer membrane protein insertion porin family
MKKILLFVALAALWFRAAFAIEAFEVRDIRVDGLQRISVGTVFTYLPFKVGEAMNDQRSAEVVRALYKTGFFKDVALAREGDVLVVTVTERPAISDIKITGNQELETEQLLEALKQVGLAKGRDYDRSLADKVEQELKRQYFAQGKYAVRITTTATPLERNRVALAIEISEGKVARIRKINIVGNNAFDDETLLDTFQLTEPTWISFITGDDQYSKQKLGADLEALRSFYLDRGYVNFNVESTQVSITPDKRDIYITLNVREGEVHSVGEVKLSGELVVPAAELTPLITLHQGATFSRKAATESAEAITRRLGDEGYAFANVNPTPEIHKEEKTVTLTFFVDPGRRAYVRRINFSGNYRTRDEVLRREMRQQEGGWFSTEAVERSRTRLERLGFFDEVTVETPAVPGSPDQVDVNYKVTERSSGNLTLGLGYSQGQGLIFNTSVSQDNFLGTGNHVALAFNNSDVNTVYSFAYNNPYYTLDGVSRGFGAFYRETDADEANLSNYTTDTYGADIHYGIPITEYDNLRLQLGFENLELKTTTSTSTEVTDYIAANGNQFDMVKPIATWSHDTRNRAILPDRGQLHRTGLEVAVPGLDLEFYKLTHRSLAFVPLSRNLTLSLNGELGYGDGYSDTDELPFFENFYAGGPRSVRGYEDNTLGPEDSAGDPIGANLMVQGNIELIFPVPFLKENRSVRLSAFADIGNVYEDADFDAGELRYSTGVSLIWISPLGPLSFSLAYPINDQDGDDTQPFQFSIGAGL